MKRQQQKKAIQLFKQGNNQREIAQKLNVTEKTIGLWVKPYKAIYKAQPAIIAATIQRISKEIAQPNLNTDLVSELNKLLTTLKTL